ncbi:MAG: anti-sigma regulatory factor [Syntrophomonas sp.]
MECMERNETIIINNEADIVVARQKARELAKGLGFSATDQAKIATAVSELARNIVVYAKRGEIVCRILINGQRKGIEIVARDQGPGIANIELALTDGISTSNGLGIGLPGARRLMGELHIESASGQGTSIMARKWLN